MKFIKKIATVFMAAAILSTTSGCYGEFALTKNIYNWNGSATGNKFVNQLIFYGLVIIPVYGVVMIADVVIFNLIEFWGGSNPISMNEGDFEKQVIPYGDDEYIVEATKNQFKIYKDGEPATYLRFDESTSTWSMVDEEGNSEDLISLQQSEDGDNYLIYKDNSIVSLDADTDYSESMLNYVFKEVTE